MIAVKTSFQMATDNQDFFHQKSRGLRSQCLREMKQVACLGQVVMGGVGPTVPASPASCRPPHSPACSEKPPAGTHRRGPASVSAPVVGGGGALLALTSTGELPARPQAH